MSKSNLNPMAGYDYTNNSRYNFKGKSTSGQPSGGNTMGGGLVETTYDELVKLRDGGKLVPGCYYRITDYETIIDPTLETYNDNTKPLGEKPIVLDGNIGLIGGNSNGDGVGKVDSGDLISGLVPSSGDNNDDEYLSIPNFDVAGHKFDIVVMALTNDTLSENASALRSKDDEVTSVRMYSNNENLVYVINMYSSCYSRYTFSNCSDKSIKLYQKDLIQLEIDGNQVTGYKFYQEGLVEVGTELTIFIPIDTLENLIQYNDYYYTENNLYTLDSSNNILGTMTMYINDEKIHYDRVNSGIDSQLSVFCSGNECLGISSVTGCITKETKQINDTYKIYKEAGIDLVMLMPGINKIISYEYFNIPNLEKYFDLPDEAVIGGIGFSVQNDKLKYNLKFNDLQITCVYIIGEDYENYYYRSIPISKLGNPNNIQLETHTYFENSILESWKLKYCLDNSKCRFDWVSDKEAEEDIHHEGEIVSVTDNDGNVFDVEYYNTLYCEEQEKIQYKLTSKNQLLENTTRYTLELNVSSLEITQIGYATVPYNCYEAGMEILMHLSNIEYSEGYDEHISIRKSKGVIYYMEDEFGNRAGFDFKNIGVIENGEFFRHIFSGNLNGEFPDYSLNTNGVINCTDNEILVQGMSLLNRFAQIGFKSGTYNFTNNTIIPYAESPVITGSLDPVSNCVNNENGFVSKYAFNSMVEHSELCIGGICGKVKKETKW